VGLTLKHTRGHVFRALVEAVCFGTEAVLAAMRAAGFRRAHRREARCLRARARRLQARPRPLRLFRPVLATWLGLLGPRPAKRRCPSRPVHTGCRPPLPPLPSTPPLRSPSSLTVAGGATRSDLWLQLHADVTNLPLLLTE
jgi:glycerol kinase